MQEPSEKKCVFCGAVLEGVRDNASGEFRCRRCGTTGRFEGADLKAVFIPNYFARLEEIKNMNREILGEIQLESMKGELRDMRFLQKKHLERQSILAEYSFLSYFRPFVEKW